MYIAKLCHVFIVPEAFLVLSVAEAKLCHVFIVPEAFLVVSVAAALLVPVVEV